MDNIEATKIEKGIVVNPSKKVKISKWDKLVENASKVNEKAMSVQPVMAGKPEWEIVNNSFENVDVEKHARPIRIAEQSYSNMESRWNKQVEDSYTATSEIDYEIPTFDYEEKKSLEDYGYTEDFSKAVEDAVNSNFNFEENKEPNFEIPKFDEYEQKPPIEMTTNNKEEKDDDIDFTEMIKKALDESLKEEPKEVEKTEFDFKKENFGINNFDLSENGLMDIVKAKENALREKIAQNRQLEAGTMRIEKSISALKESKANYENKIQEYINRIESESEAESQREVDLESRKRESIEAMLVADKEEKEAQDCYEYIQKSRVA